MDFGLALNFHYCEKLISLIVLFTVNVAVFGLLESFTVCLYRPTDFEIIIVRKWKCLERLALGLSVYPSLLHEVYHFEAGGLYFNLTL